MDMKAFGIRRTLRVTAVVAAASALALVFGASQAAATGLPQVESQHLHTCAVLSDASATCWGNNDYGQSTAPAGSFVQISAGFWTSCGVRSDGSAACWGWNGWAQNSPPAGAFSSVSIGYAHACGLRPVGTVTCWGGYGWGTTPPSGTFKAVGAGNDWSCGLRTNDTLSCWNSDPGHGEMSYPSGTFTSLSVGVNHACAVRTDGTVACWGYNPLGATNAPGGTFTSVSAGHIHSCGVRTDGTLACWGYNGTGAASPPAGTFNSVTTGTYHSCGVRTSGAIVCWGYNGNGQTDVPATDSTPPAIGNVVSGTPGANGWHTEDVGLDWSVDEPESPDSLSTTGCVDLSITTDQAETTYSCSATSAGGSSGPVEVVIKRDATPPTVDCASPAPQFLSGDTDAFVTASVSDATSGPAAGSVSAAADTATVGEKTALLTGADNAGNETTATCSYTVLDPTPPEIASLINGTLGANGWYTSVVGLTWTVSEPETLDSLVLSECVDQSITADQAETTYACSATSAGGSAGPIAVAIKRDATAPSITCSSPIPAFSLGQVGTLVTASVSDATSGPVSSSLSAAADTATVGLKSVSLTGADNAGNATTAACAYRVGFGFSGFFQPVDNDLLNKANAGRAIPLKWRLTDASGSPVTDLATASITTVTLNCGTLSEGVDAIEEYAAGASGLQNLGDGYYQINWKSPTTYAGTCKRLRLDLGEGAYRTADFRFVN